MKPNPSCPASLLFYQQSTLLKRDLQENNKVMIDSATPLRACLGEFEGMKKIKGVYVLIWVRFSQANQSKTMVVGNKNWKIEIFFYSISGKDLRR